MAAGAVKSCSAGMVVGAPNVGVVKEQKVGGVVVVVASGEGGGQDGQF